MALNLGVLIGLGATDEKAKVSATDTTAGYLNGKLVAGTNISFVQNNTGANETLTLNVAASSPAIGGAITGGTQYAVLFVDGAQVIAQDVVNLNYNNSTNRLGLGVAATSARLHIRGEGATSATNALYIVNSTPAVLFHLQNDGMFSLGLSSSNNDYRNAVLGGLALSSSGVNSVVLGYNAASANNQNTIIGSESNANGARNTVIGYNSDGSTGNGSIAIGANITQSGGGQQPITIGDECEQAGDYTIFISQATGESGSITNRAATYDIGIGAFIHYQSTATSSGNNIMIGGYIKNTYGGSQNYNIIIGRDAENSLDTGGNFSMTLGHNTRLGNGATAVTEGVMILGSGASNLSKLTNIENNSLIIGFKDQYESFKLYKRGVLVFNGANAASVVDGTNVDSSCTNTTAIVSGTAPVTAVANTAQMFSNDSGQLSYLDENGFTISL